MIEVVVANLKPTTEHRFIFICQREHYEKYDLHNILKNATDNKFEVIQINGVTEGAACTALLAKQYTNNDDDLLIANSDQYIDTDINDFISKAREGAWDGYIMTFETSHPKWSYARLNAEGRVVEVAEKKVISQNATVGIYYYKHGKDYVEGAEAMIHKNVRHNNEFYVCPVYNEFILAEKAVGIYPILPGEMHGLGTPEDLQLFLQRKDTR
jgi:dTDP-glucose pyrophosphorylase